MFYRKWKITHVVLDVQSAAHLEAFLIKPGIVFLAHLVFLAHVLGLCRGVAVQSHASYAEACIHHWRILWNSNRKLTWVRFEPMTTEFCSDALTNWAIRPRVQLALRANFVQLLQFHGLFSEKHKHRDRRYLYHQTKNSTKVVFFSEWNNNITTKIDHRMKTGIRSPQQSW